MGLVLLLYLWVYYPSCNPKCPSNLSLFICAYISIVYTLYKYIFIYTNNQNIVKYLVPETLNIVQVCVDILVQYLISIIQQKPMKCTIFLINI